MVSTVSLVRLAKLFPTKVTYQEVTTWAVIQFICPAAPVHDTHTHTYSKIIQVTLSAVGATNSVFVCVLWVRDFLKSLEINVTLSVCVFTRLCVYVGVGKGGNRSHVACIFLHSCMRIP